MKQNRKVLLGALALSTLIFAGPKPAQAEVNFYFNSGTPSCQTYTRNFVDNRGFQRAATGTACLHNDGVWRVVSEGPARVIGPVYYNPVVYRAPPAVVYYNTGRNNWNNHYNVRWDNDRHDNRHNTNYGRGHDRDRGHDHRH